MFQKNMEIVKLLLEHNFDVNAVGPQNGYTPLHDAVWANNIEAVRLLLDRNAKTNIQGKDGLTPFRQGLPEHWIIDLGGLGQNKLDELASMGIQDIRDVPDSFPLSEIQDRIRRCVKNNEEYISRELRGELERVEYPVHFLDFETLGFAVPRYAGTRPYQTVPFQWSDHVLHEDGRLEHREYLCEEDKDPREEFARTLLGALGRRGSIVTYTTYEEGVIRGLAEDFPQYRDQLLATLGRVKDLHAIIRKNYYHPGFHGSFSLKSVVPALLPEMNYENLAIQEGQQAGLEYLRMIDPSTSTEERERIKAALLAYCGQDTLTMVKIAVTSPSVPSGGFWP